MMGIVVVTPYDSESAAITLKRASISLAAGRNLERIDVVPPISVISYGGARCKAGESI
jgi:hypothetical protein